MEQATPPPPMNDVPPMDNGMGNGEPPIDDMNNDGNMQGQNPFDTNFDAGVEADENTDPKKYIQQLTGKLSQSLRSYNENLPQPDADLDKYVAGMIIKQAVKGLSPDDTNEILNKVKGDDSDNTQPETNDDNNQQPPIDGGEMNNADAQFDPNMGMGESKQKTNKQKIDEIFNQVIRNDDDDSQMQKPVTNIGYKKKPFTSPNFK